MRAQQSSVAFEASYRIAFRIAQSKKPHTIGEELIKPSLVEATSLVVRVEAIKQVKRKFAFKRYNQISYF